MTQQTQETSIKANWLAEGQRNDSQNMQDGKLACLIAERQQLREGLAKVLPEETLNSVFRLECLAEDIWAELDVADCMEAKLS